MFKVTCNKEKKWLREWLPLGDIYGGLPHEHLSLRDANEVCAQLNEFLIDNEFYVVREEVAT